MDTATRFTLTNANGRSWQEHETAVVVANGGAAVSILSKSEGQPVAAGWPSLSPQGSKNMTTIVTDFCVGAPTRLLVELVDADGLVYDQRAIHPDDLGRLNAAAQAESAGELWWLAAHTETVTQIAYVANRYRVTLNGAAAGAEIDPFTACWLIRRAQERGWVADSLVEEEPFVREIYTLTADNSLIDLLPGDFLDAWRADAVRVAQQAAVPFEQARRRSPVSGRWKGGR